MTIMDVSKAQIDTEKPWVKEKRAKRAKGSEAQTKIAEATNGGSIFDLYENMKS